MACWRGESSTSAFGGDWLPSAIFDSDPGTALAAFLPAASAAALSCCGEGFVPFLPFPVSLQARRTGRNEQNVAVLWINLSYVDSKRPTEPAGSKLECQSDPGSFAACFCREWRNDGSIDTRSNVFIGNSCSFLLREANLHRARNVKRQRYIYADSLYLECVYSRESTRSWIN